MAEVVFILRYLCKKALPTLAALAAVLALAALLPGGSIPVARPAEDRRQVPILMYHSLLMDTAAAGPYVLSPTALEADMIWLLEAGYTPVSMASLIDFVAGRGTLPQRPVVITFDDGHLNNLTYLPALLEAHDFCATIAVVGQFADTATRIDDPHPAYAYLTWADIAALADNDRIEIGNHSYFAHGRVPTNAMVTDAYGDMLVQDAGDMQQALREKSGVSATVYAYPYGFIVPGTDTQLAQLGIQATLGCAQRVNTVTVGDWDCLYSMGRFNRPAGEASADFLPRVLGDR